MTHCIHNIQPPIHVHTDINRNILDNIMSLPDHVRKVLRLLAKQYLIFELINEPDNICEHLGGIDIVRKNPVMIHYTDFNNPNGEVFEMVISVN